MPAQPLEPLFTTQPFGTGNGLGLSLVHQFVNENQGKLSLQSICPANLQCTTWRLNLSLRFFSYRIPPWINVKDKKNEFSDSKTA